MQIVKCTLHDDEFSLPTENEEYYSGKYHDNIESLCKHREIHGNCRFAAIEK